MTKRISWDEAVSKVLKSKDTKGVEYTSVQMEDDQDVDDFLEQVRRAIEKRNAPTLDVIAVTKSRGDYCKQTIAKDGEKDATFYYTDATSCRSFSKTRVLIIDSRNLTEADRFLELLEDGSVVIILMHKHFKSFLLYNTLIKEGII